MMYPTYRDKYLPALTLEEVGAIPDKASALVIIPVGAVEQHGPHLPVGVDSLIGQARLDTALPLLPDGTNVWVAPAIQIGKSNEHTGYPGTLMVSKTVLRRQLLVIARQLKDWGFSSIAILNTHGGNRQVLNYSTREMEDDLGMRVHPLQYSSGIELDPQEAAFGFHAGQIETAIMLEIMDEGTIDMSRARCEFPARLEDPGKLRPECAPAIYSWVSADVSKSGIMGDATAATPELGKKWVQAEAKSLADAIMQICSKLKF
jgi:creatinine amidohydrolase